VATLGTVIQRTSKDHQQHELFLYCLAHTNKNMHTVRNKRKFHAINSGRKDIQKQQEWFTF